MKFEQEIAEAKEECISILNAPFPLLPPVQTSRTAGVNGKFEMGKFEIETLYARRFDQQSHASGVASE